MTRVFLNEYHVHLTDLIRDADIAEERERLRNERSRVAYAIAFWRH